MLLMPIVGWGQSSAPQDCHSSVVGNRSGEIVYGQCQNYLGEWRNGLYHGYGVFTSTNGSRYVGEWRDGRRHGYGIEYGLDGSINRSGEWESGNFVLSISPDLKNFPFDGVRRVALAIPQCPTSGVKHNCIGTLVFPNGARYVGEFQSGVRFGRGTEYNHRGEVSRDGWWDDWKFSSIPMSGQGNTRLSTAQISAIPPPTAALDSISAERDRLAAEVAAAWKRQQELEERLAQEARDRERLVAEARERERPQSSRPASSRNERRIALVIGNSTYTVSPLENPANDAADIADALTKAGFKTTLVRNATLGQMRDATRRFADQLPSSDVALIYFAGHGIESNRKNYMIPVNADLKFEYELSDQAYDAGVWLEMLESIKSGNADRVNIVILDACRNNTLIGARNLGRGLGKMDAPAGTFLAYSTAPGKVAADGTKGDRNSPFTKHLLRAMQQPGLAIEEVFKEVRRNVSRDTNGAQVPWESTSLTGFFAFSRSR